MRFFTFNFDFDVKHRLHILHGVQEKLFTEKNSCFI